MSGSHRVPGPQWSKRAVGFLIQNSTTLPWRCLWQSRFRVFRFLSESLKAELQLLRLWQPAPSHAFPGLLSQRIDRVLYEDGGDLNLTSRKGQPTRCTRKRLHRTRLLSSSPLPVSLPEMSRME